MRINVHAGHNPDGKIGCGAIGIIKESTENRRVATEVIRQLEGLGHTVFDCTVDNGANSSDVLRKIVKKCNANKVDLDVSIHFNATGNPLATDGKTTGTEVYIHNANSKSKPYAEQIAKAVSTLGYRNRGIKVHSSFYVLRNTNAPALLIECCFVNDADDIKIYDHYKMAQAIVEGIVGERYIEPALNASSKDDIAKNEETLVGNPKQLYRVQVGAYGVKSNADKMYKKLKKEGFEAYIIKA